MLYDITKLIVRHARVSFMNYECNYVSYELRPVITLLVFSKVRYKLLFKA